MGKDLRARVAVTLNVDRLVLYVLAALLTTCGL
jgi:hypothetical protein